MKGIGLWTQQVECREETGSVVFFIYTPCRCADQRHAAALEFHIPLSPQNSAQLQAKETQCCMISFRKQVQDGLVRTVM